jgi:L-ascorbate metabolism protein UlaG (beta-lactamase superfamily)
MPIQITWLGHAGFLLNLDGTNVLIDPFLTGNPLASHNADDIPADYILLTHAHGDHVGDTLPIAQRTGAQVIGMVEVARYLGSKGVRNTHGQNIGGGFIHSFGHVKFVRADHSSTFPDGTYGGLAAGIVLTAGGKRMYFAGDTALFSDMRLIGDMRIDIAFLPIGDNFTMGPDDALEAVKLIRPRYAYPIHYNTFDVIVQDPAEWARRIHHDTTADAIVTDPGTPFSI